MACCLPSVRLIPHIVTIAAGARRSLPTAGPGSNASASYRAQSAARAQDPSPRLPRLQAPNPRYPLPSRPAPPEHVNLFRPSYGHGASCTQAVHNHQDQPDLAAPTGDAGWLGASWGPAPQLPSARPSPTGTSSAGREWPVGIRRRNASGCQRGCDHSQRQPAVHKPTARLANRKPGSGTEPEKALPMCSSARIIVGPRRMLNQADNSVCQY